MPPVLTNRWVEKEYIDKAPIWCSVDLRDGNQSLITPMNLEEKLEFFKMLVKIGFKEIEIGFPAASETEFEFCRKLIEDDLIPEDVTMQVLTQSRKHIIDKTFEAIKGCKRAVVHLYNSTSVAQRAQVFKKSKEEIINIAIEGAKILEEHKSKTDSDIVFEYSPESFTGTEIDYALEICNAVLDVWQPNENKKVIINLPVTVEVSMPHIYASQIEYMCDNLKYRDNVIVSLHAHNDRGCGVADTEMGILAGADRVEGTLFGNGERTGNADIVTLALNMFSQGIDPKLDFSDITKIAELYERVTKMHIYERMPYSGQLVFAAFSGSHQDAIAKGMKYSEENSDSFWTVPYLPIDPHDIGREYEGDVIRINSQSGKGGIGYLMEQKFGYILPANMRESFGYMVKDVSDKNHKELLPEDVYNVFKDNFVNIVNKVSIEEIHYSKANSDEIIATVDVNVDGTVKQYKATGNGRLDACSNAVKQAVNLDFSIENYQEHALEKSSKSLAAAYVGITLADGNAIWGVGIHSDIITASVNALISAVNNALK